MNIFLDDIRNPNDCASYMHKRIGLANSIYINESWIIARNFEEFQKVVENNIGKIKIISFDHDLADSHYDPSMYESHEKYEEAVKNVKEKTGYDCAVWFKELYTLKDLAFPTIVVHSMNPVGAQKITQVFEDKSDMLLEEITSDELAFYYWTKGKAGAFRSNMYSTYFSADVVNRFKLISSFPWLLVAENYQSCPGYWENLQKRIEKK